MRKLVTLWFRYVSSQLAQLVATIGVVELIACLLMLWVVRWLSGEVLERESFTFDTAILLWLHQWANPRLDAVMLTLTKLGNPEVVLLITPISLILLWWKGKQKEAKMLTIACLGAVILNQGLKLGFTRPRPVLWHRLISEVTFSFPSGHALGSLVLYGFLAYILALQLPKYSSLIYGLATGLIASIGLSRIYLGVHWPTDILAGYSIGFLWLMICVVMLKLQRERVADLTTEAQK